MSVIVKGPFCCPQRKTLAISELIAQREVERLARKAVEKGMTRALARRLPAAKEALAGTRRAIDAHTCTNPTPTDAEVIEHVLGDEHHESVEAVITSLVGGAS